MHDSVEYLGPDMRHTAFDGPSAQYGIEIHTARITFTGDFVERWLEIVSRISRTRDVAAHRFDGIVDSGHIIKGLRVQHRVRADESRRHLHIVQNTAEIGRAVWKDVSWFHRIVGQNRHAGFVEPDRNALYDSRTRGWR